MGRWINFRRVTAEEVLFRCARIQVARVA
ncbi:uncharacterized protein G2W53_028411 [Senna tora]|uniref:Uncharacterized protein n=1 Tax=Senna tora TaxID=362788 RepID=A0A834T5Y5_9FABA|nr:uncharacterized protein G2W53_028411 [Senna tora]